MSQAFDIFTNDELNPNHWESLATRELQALLLRYLITYGVQIDAALVSPLYMLYEHCVDRIRAEERHVVYQQVFRAAEQRSVSLHAYMPFVLDRRGEDVLVVRHRGQARDEVDVHDRTDSDPGR